MTLKCKFCDAKADFRYGKSSTKESPDTYPPTDFCFECYEQKIGKGVDEYDPIEVRDMAMKILAERKSRN